MTELGRKSPIRILSLNVRVQYIPAVPKIIRNDNLGSFPAF